VNGVKGNISINTVPTQGLFSIGGNAFQGPEAAAANLKTAFLKFSGS